VTALVRSQFRLALVVIALCLIVPGLSACTRASGLAREPRPVVDTVWVSLDEAKRLMGSGEVIRAFQPHYGPVTLEMTDGRWFCFDQPHLDWVIGHMRNEDLFERFPLVVE